MRLDHGAFYSKTVKKFLKKKYKIFESLDEEKYTKCLDKIDDFVSISLFKGRCKSAILIFHIDIGKKNAVDLHKKIKDELSFIKEQIKTLKMAPKAYEFSYKAFTSHAYLE